MGHNQSKDNKQIPWHFVFAFLLSILFFVILSEESPNGDRNVVENANKTLETEEVEVIDGITIDYLTTYLEEVGFDVRTRKGAISWMTTGQWIVPNSRLQVDIEIYHEDREKGITLIDLSIDGSNYNESVQTVEQINKFAKQLYGTFAKLPYRTSTPDKAKAWVEDNASKANKQGNVKEAKFGIATFVLSGSPLMRSFEITTLSN